MGTDRIYEVVRCPSGEDKVVPKAPDEVSSTTYINKKHIKSKTGEQNYGIFNNNLQ